MKSDQSMRGGCKIVILQEHFQHLPCLESIYQVLLRQLRGSRHNRYGTISSEIMCSTRTRVETKECIKAASLKHGASIRREIEEEDLDKT